MELNITRHDTPTQETDSETTKNTQEVKHPTLTVDQNIIPPNLKPLERQMALMAEYLVERALKRHLSKATAQLKSSMRELEDETLTHTTKTIAQVQKRFAASIEEMVDLNLLPRLTEKEIQTLSTFLQGMSEAKTLKDTAQKKLDTLKEAIQLENEAKSLQQDSWENSGYTQEETIQKLCELVSKYIPVDTNAAKATSLKESEELLTGGRIENMSRTKRVSDKDTYLKNTPVYRAMLLFRAVNTDCDSKALCGTCPFKSKGEECRLWKQAFALHDIAFYRAQSVSQEQYENSIEQKLVEAQIEISSLKQQLTETQARESDLQSKLDKLTAGSRHLTEAKKKQSEENNYETELDPYLRFR